MDTFKLPTIAEAATKFNVEIINLVALLEHYNYRLLGEGADVSLSEEMYNVLISNYKGDSALALHLIQRCFETKKEYLDLGCCGLNNIDFEKGTEINSALSKCTHLKKLYLGIKWYNNYTEKKFVETQNKGNKNNLDFIPPVIGTLVNLEELIITELGIKKIERLDELLSLQLLDLSHNRINTIEGLDNLINLKILDIDYNEIEELKGLENLIGLRELYLSFNLITEIKGLQNLTALDELWLSNNKIKEIKGLENLIDLKELMLNKNQITKIEGLENLTSLEELYLQNNQIQEIDGLENLIKLRILYLLGNQLTEIKGLESLTALQELYLNGNKITEIKGIETLIHLHILYLSENKISKIEGLDKLNALIKLQLDINEIEDIKTLSFLLNKGNDFYLNIDRNPFEKKYDLKLKQFTNHYLNIKEILKRLLGGEVDITPPIKIVMLGNHNSGKSSIVNFLINKSIHNKSTDILRIENYNIDTKSKGKLPKAIFYDFGGQDFYHGIYRAFMSNDSLQIIVCDTKTDMNSYSVDSYNTPIVNFNRKYWLGQKKYNENADSHSPYIMIQTRLDENGITEAESLSRKVYKGDGMDFFLAFPPHELTEKLSLDKANFFNIGRQYFRAYIDSKIASLSVTRKEPEWYPDYLGYIMNKSKHKTHQHTAIEKLLDYYKLEGTKEERIDNLKTNLEGLNSQGLVVYYNQKELEDYVWLNPEKLVAYIQTKVLIKEKLKDNGIVEKVAFEKQVDEKIVALLKVQRVIFLNEDTVNDKPEYIIPNYLPLTNKKDADYQLFTFGLNSPDFILKFNDFIPFGFINQMICFFGKQPDIKKFWRNQLLFTLNSEARVLIELDFKTLQIRVHVQQLKESRSCKEKILEYLFYCILGLYHDLSKQLFDYDDFLKYEENKRIQFYELENVKNTTWHALKNVIKEFPSDLFISVDDNRFISYCQLQMLQENEFTINSYSLEEENINENDIKTIPVYPFQPFTSKKLGVMKKVFISYSKQDLGLVNKFIDHLAALKLDKKIETWYCTELSAGSEWDKEIQSHFDAADIVCFMVSSNFMRTKYIHEYEIKKAFERKKKDDNFKIVPIILDFCRWTTTGEYNLGKYTALPYTAKPVADFDNQNMAWYIIEECLRLIIEKDFQPQDESTFSSTNSDLPEDVKRIFVRIVEEKVNKSGK